MSQSDTASPVAFDPRDPAFIADPYPTFHRLRSAAPVWKSPFGRWFITCYDDAAAILRDRRMGKNFADQEALIRRFGPAAMTEPSIVELSQMMLVRDPPDHTRLRGLVTKAFTARRIEQLHDRVAGLVRDLLDRVAHQGHMDVIRDFAYPLPVLVICELLGIPEGDRARFAPGTGSLPTLLNPTPPSRQELDAANAATQATAAYFEALFEQCRRAPQDDLITMLVQVEEAGDRLTRAELRANVALLFAAGHETTANLIGNGLLALLRHRDQWARLGEDPGLVPHAIEELLRYDAPVQTVTRTVSEPMELRGHALQKGEPVTVLIGAANRDPKVFPDPDLLDVTRPQPRSFSFGGGAHFCLGAQLARLEGEIAFAALLHRLPSMMLADTGPPRWSPTFTLRGLTSLPVRWS